MLLDNKDPLYQLYLKIRAINEILPDRNSCFYCGDLATQEDHVIPHSFPHSGDNRMGWFVDTVPSCQECNAVLHTSLFDTLDERLAYLAGKMKLRYKSELKHPVWSKQELSELSPRLRKQISDRSNARKWAELRINNLERPDHDIPAAALLNPLLKKGNGFDPPKAVASSSDGKAGILGA